MLTQYKLTVNYLLTPNNLPKKWYNNVHFEVKMSNIIHFEHKWSGLLD